MPSGTNLRALVSPPTFEPSPYGLLSVVQLRGDDGTHWRAGVTWEDICGGAGTTVDYCTTSATVITGVGSVPAKQATTSRSIYGATPFTVFVEVDCSPVDFEADGDAIITNALNRFETYWVERAFWTGNAGDRSNGGVATANAVLPHLASNAAVNESLAGSSTRNVILQMQATIVTGVALSVTDALGALEGALATCLNGTGVIHVPQALAPTMALLLQRQGQRLLTPNGNQVAIGSGYPGTSPAGAAPTLGTAWMYATGPVFAYRGTPTILGDPYAQIDRSTNTMKVIIERPYVMGYDCCLFAQLVNTASFIATSITGP